MNNTKFSDRQTPSSKQPIYWIGITNDLDVSPFTGNLLLLVNEADVINSIINLIETNPFERIKQPKIGSGVQQLLFENINDQTTATLQDNIETTINLYEPRAELISVVVIPNPAEQLYQITITFTTLTTPNPISFTKTLYRLR